MGRERDVDTKSIPHNRRIYLLFVTERQRERDEFLKKE